MANPLSAADESTWIGDGTEGAVLNVDGSTITLGSAQQGTPYNIRLDAPTLSPCDSLYYEVELIESDGNLSVGLVSSSEFQPGWKTSGMFYNGNLTNGNAGLLIGFGDYLKSGDQVGVHLLRDGTQCKLVYHINGRCLGTGFVINSEKTFYPCLHLDGKASIKYSAPPSFPSATERQPVKYSDAYSGDWLLEKANLGPELHELSLPKDFHIILSFVSVDPTTYRLSIKVGNTFNTTVKLSGKMENFDEIQVGPAMATRMMPPPLLQPVEQFMQEGLPTLFKMIVSETGDMIMTGTTAEMLCRRYEKTFEPVTCTK